MKIVLDKLDKENLKQQLNIQKENFLIQVKRKRNREDKPKQLEQMINTIRRALAFSQAGDNV